MIGYTATLNPSLSRYPHVNELVHIRKVTYHKPTHASRQTLPGQYVLTISVLRSLELSDCVQEFMECCALRFFRVDSEGIFSAAVAHYSSI